MPTTRKHAVSASYEAAERPKTVASQPASHRRRPLEVAIFDGTNKYQWTEHTLTNLLVCRSCSEVACGLCRPLACLMAWAHRKVELSKIVPRGRKTPMKLHRGCGIPLLVVPDTCKSNRVELGNIRYAPKKVLGNSNMRMTTPGPGSNTPRFISVAFLIAMKVKNRSLTCVLI